MSEQWSSLYNMCARLLWDDAEQKITPADNIFTGNSKKYEWEFNSTPSTLLGYP
jgi:hypothetical protein